MKEKSKKAPIMLIKPTDYRLMKWKNGKGNTQEIALFPDPISAVLPENLDSISEEKEEDFSWRLSTAPLVANEANENTEFSKFPGYNRILVLLEGKLLHLKFKERKHEVKLAIGDVVQFAGEETVLCEEISPAAKDLNFIYRKGEIKAKLEVIALSGKTRSFKVEGKTVLAFAFGGEVKATLYPGEIKKPIPDGATLQLDPVQIGQSEDVLLHLAPASPQSSVVLIEIFDLSV